MHTLPRTGTWSGITSRLDYLQDLGMTSIWITPIVQQAAGTYGGADGYHGYWAGDWTRVDPHYGTEAELQQLLRATKQRGACGRRHASAMQLACVPARNRFSRLIRFL